MLHDSFQYRTNCEIMNIIKDTEFNNFILSTMKQLAKYLLRRV